MITKLFYHRLDSTRLEYERLAKTGSASDRWIIRAEEQTAGQGRGDNPWHSPRGGLWLSFDLIYPRPVASLPLYVGYCLHALLGRLFEPANLKVKWPNDIYLEGDKLAGILCHYQESSSKYVISLGVNTNVLKDDVLLKYDAAILLYQLAMPVSNTLLAELITNQVEANTALLAQPQTYIKRCAEILYGKGQEAEVQQSGKVLSGRIWGLSEEGFLLLRNSFDEVETVTHGSLNIL